jgi:UDP-N-acetylmuramoylalanine--D-glutamate ligase
VDLKGKKVAIVGLGASGVAAARLCLARGAAVVVTDVKAQGELSPDARALAREGAAFACGGHAGAALDRADLVVVSPGVPRFPELALAEQAGVPIWSEIELATRLLALRPGGGPAPIVAVGGTNGKSTTTELVGAMLRADGRSTFVGGNLGEPLASHVDEAFDAVVLEVSSFQLERVDRFKPRVAVLLNVTPDHLDRYPSFDAYARAKGNAFARQDDGDLAVVPAGDEVCLGEARRGGARILTFGARGDVAVEDDAIVDHRTRERYARDGIALAGGHNALNAAAAIAAAGALDVGPAAIRRALAEFRGLPHRTAFVAQIHGVRYYDDSKGTNVGAAVTALGGLRELRAVLIAGGRDKGGSYEPLVDALVKKGRAAVVIGEAQDTIARAIGDRIRVCRASSIDEAVRASARLAEPGDAVLLSPACSSFDMFRDYKHRGDEFVRAVRELEREVEVRS